MTDLGLLKQFLGLEIEQSERWIKVKKKNYASDILFKFKMSECKESKFPFLSGIKLGEVGESPLMDNSLYRHVVERMLYITHSRPDLGYVVCDVERYMYQPHYIHWKETKRILHYVQGTRHLGVQYAPNSPLELLGFTNSDWDGDPIVRNYT